MTRHLHKLVRSLQGLSTRTRMLVLVWAVFSLLVACGIHGSSIPAAAEAWSPESSYTGYVFGALQPGSGTAPSFRDRFISNLLMTRPRYVRSDEWLMYTPFALAQLSHNLRFPVVNKNIGTGQNMLSVPCTPVWHLCSVARPNTWGYFLGSPRQGLAWQWWFQVFGCFTVLCLLFEVILGGHWKLAAFGAFWFCSSAYTVCWSLWPAHVTMFAALACLSAYHLLASSKPRVQIISAVLLGLSISGFAMILYPAWQVPLAYLFLLIFASLCFRDRLHRAFKAISLSRIISMTLAAAVLLIIGGSFLTAALPALKLMSNTTYPGHRVSLGGDLALRDVFRGTYNLISIYKTPELLRNNSEASSFYLLFPAALVGYALSKRLRSALGVIGLALIGFLGFMLLFVLAGFPRPIAMLSLFTYVPTERADLPIGLASIILCVMILARTNAANALSVFGSLAPAISGGVAMFVLLLITGLSLMKSAGGFPSRGFLLAASAMVAVTSVLMLTGRVKLFCAVMGLILVATAASFNPLATNLDFVYRSELARAITRFNQTSETPPLWVCYGGKHAEMLVAVLGGRTISGIHWPPQVSFWRMLDPAGNRQSMYNRLAYLTLTYDEDDYAANLSGSGVDLTLRISPANPILRTMGARYILACGEAQRSVNQRRFPLVHKSDNGDFSIFEIPEEPHPDVNNVPVRLSTTPWYEGAVTSVDCDRVEGWVFNRSDSGMRLTVSVFDGATLLGSAVAESYRQDLADRGEGDGRYGFMFPMPPQLKDGRRHLIRVIIEGTDQPVASGATSALLCPSPGR